MENTKTHDSEMREITTRVQQLLPKYPSVLKIIASESKIPVPTSDPSAFASYLTTKCTPENEIRILRLLRKHEQLAHTWNFRIQRHRSHKKARHTRPLAGAEHYRDLNPERYFRDMRSITTLEDLKNFEN